MSEKLSREEMAEELPSTVTPEEEAKRFADWVDFLTRQDEGYLKGCLDSYQRNLKDYSEGLDAMIEREGKEKAKANGNLEYWFLKSGVTRNEKAIQAVEAELERRKSN